MTVAECWKFVPGYNLAYEVSNLGRVRSVPRVSVDRNGVARAVKGRVLRPVIRGSGHLRVDLGHRNPHTIHRLVMLAFVGPCPDGLEVLHADHNPANNALSNLSYGTRSRNIKDDFAAGTRSHKCERAPNAKLSDLDVKVIRSSAASSMQLAEIFGVTARNINSVRQRKTFVNV